MRILDRLRDITPIRIPRSAQGLVLFGGTFDPPHRWHLRVASAVRRRLFGSGGWIVFVPAARSPLKGHGPVASATDRVAMLRLATRRMSRVAIWTDEIDRSSWWRGPSYTVDTLGRLRSALLRDVPTRLLIGADQAADFGRWKDSPDILCMAMPAVVWRPPVTSARGLRRALGRSPRGPKAEEERFEFWLSLVVPAPVDPMSSTEVRRLLGRMQETGRVPEALKRMLDPAVLAYVRGRGLFAAATRGRRPVSGRPS